MGTQGEILKGVAQDAGFAPVAILGIGWGAETEGERMTKTPQMEREEVLRIELELLRQQHRDLDEAIHALHARGTADMLTLQRLKRQKLALKDKIARIEDELTPDIIA